MPIAEVSIILFVYVGRFRRHTVRPSLPALRQNYEKNIQRRLLHSLFSSFQANSSNAGFRYGLQLYFAEIFSTVEIGILGVDRIPRQVVGLCRLRRAGIKIPSYRCSCRCVYANDGKRYFYEQCPRVGADSLAERLCAERRCAAYGGNLGVGKSCRIGTDEPVGAVDSTYAVKLKIPVFAAVLRLEECFNARVLAYRRLVLAIHGPRYGLIDSEKQF